ncbi:MAG: DUF86 domain-containing protein [Candidatus Korarchaeota archaeon]|nr:DUF86 domain-containing protein [Candidatus Korarchaeota archaeon]
MRLHRLLQIIRENLELLDARIGSEGVDKILEDKFYLLAALHALQLASQALIDLASHVISEAGIAVPASYSEVSHHLIEAGILDESDAQLFRRIVGFRNVVVHQYAAVDLGLVGEVLRGRKYMDIARLALAISRWAEERGLDP